jgi:hypothetical protein
MLLFADLHCSPKTLNICLDVLRGIHKKALDSNQQIGFLGDFFDTVYRRGTIPVDMLNTLLEFFEKEWKVPMVMIPGNHDYIDASEKEHALEPFRHASDNICVLDKPIVLGNVLWVPWKRDNDELRALFKKFEGQFDCIFGHFDVIGAHVNNNTASDRGLKKDDFPCQVISGHYHKPQTTGNVVYIGSPYQTSMSEAGQSKRFINFKSATDFSPVYVKYGPKRFKITENPETWPHIKLKKGDIIYMDSYNPENLSIEADEYVKGLRADGVVVVLQRYLRETETANSLLSAEKELTPEEMFKMYASHFRLQEEEGYNLACDMVAKVAKEDNLMREPKELMFDSITFEGFGPFKGKQSISLNGRGLTKITGVWEEGAIGSSNGAGKSMATVSAFLWCLTGYSDMRASSTLKKSQASAACINHVTKQARVELIGNCAGEPFKIYRACSLHDKTSFLEVYYKNERITRSTQHQTQFMMNSMFFRIPKGKTLPKAPNKRLHAWLMRTLVWEQAGGVKNWLEENDKGTKEELLLLCNMNVWAELSEMVTDKYIFVESNVQSSSQLLAHSNVSLETCKGRISRLAKRKEIWLMEHEQKIGKFKEDVYKYQQNLSELGEMPVLGPRPDTSNKRKYEAISKSYFQSMKTAKDSRDIAKKYYKVDGPVGEQKYTVDVVSPVYDAPEPEPKLLENAIAEYAIRKQQHKLLTKAASAPTSCPTCKQPLCVKHIAPEQIDSALKAQQHTYNLVTARRADIKIHKRKLNEENDKQVRIKAWRTMKESATAMEAHKQQYDAIQAQEAVHEYKAAEWAAQRVILQHWDHKRSEFSTALKLINEQLDIALAEAPPMLEEEKELNSQLVDIHSSIARYRELETYHRAEIAQLKNIKQWLSVKGIQTYVVERMLHKMSKHATDWCKYLFDENTQGSPTFTMELDDNENISKVLSFGAQKEAHALSGGQYRRLQIAAFMAWRQQASIFTGIHSNLAILDEPAANIDVVGFRQMEQALKDWTRRGNNRTCMFISHDVNADRGSALYDTHIEIRAKPGNSYVHDYDGDEKK